MLKKMKHKWSGVLLLIFLAYGLCACGSSEAGASAEEPAEAPALPGDMEAPAEAPEYTYSTEEVFMMLEAGEITEDDLYDMATGGEISSETLDEVEHLMWIKSGEMTKDGLYEDAANGYISEESLNEILMILEKYNIEGTGNKSGLILLTVDYRSQNAKFEIVSLDIETGTQNVISSIQTEKQVNDEYYYDFGATWGYFYSNYKNWVSSDYKYVTATKTFQANYERHAGWFDESGVFFDVTEKLGLQSQSDFDNPVYYDAVGFEGDLFVFCSYPEGNHMNGTYYNVPVNNLTPEAVQEGNPFKTVELPDSYGLTPSYWLSDTVCLVDERDSDYLSPCAGTSYIVDLGNQTKTAYVPGESRYSWNGVFSPDGERIAFISAPKAGNEEPDLFVMPREGGDPVRIENELPFLRENGRVEHRIVSGGINCFLIDWK